MTKIKTIIVDDEKKSREGLSQLTNEFNALEVVAICKDGLEAIESIENHKPELLLLDIQMPGISGFDVLNSISYRPMTIFITAFDKYALKAFEVHALDYLLKPFTDERFRESITNAMHTIKNNQQHKFINAWEKLITMNKDWIDFNETIPIYGPSKKLVVRVDGKIQLLNFKSIIWVEAYDYYIKIHADRLYIIKESLRNMTQRLPETFLRVHKSAIINLDFIKYIEPIGHSDMIACLEGDVKVKVSRTYKTSLMNKISANL